MASKRSCSSVDVNNIVRLQKALRTSRLRHRRRRRQHPGLQPGLPRRGRGRPARAATCPWATPCSRRPTRSRRLQEYLDWLEKVAPGETPTSNGLNAWIRAQALRRSGRGARRRDLTREKLIGELETHHRLGRRRAHPARRHRRAGAGGGLLPHGPGDRGRRTCGCSPTRGSTARPTTSTSTRTG